MKGLKSQNMLICIKPQKSQLQLKNLFEKLSTFLGCFFCCSEIIVSFRQSLLLKLDEIWR